MAKNDKTDKKSKKSDPTCTYSKLKSGNWGIRSTQEIAAGDTVTVTLKDGTSRDEKVERVVWSGDGVWIAAVVGKDGRKPAPKADDDSGSEDDDLAGDDE